MKNGRWDWMGLSRLIRNGERSQQSIVMFGTAFAWVHFLDWCEEEKVTFELPAGSQVIETGGYKGKTRELSRDELHRQLGKRLGLPRNQIYSEYAMCELSSQAYSFSKQRGSGKETLLFRFPPWCQARVVQPMTRKACPFGKKGVLEIYDLANLESCSFIRTEDLAIAHREGFELLGRVPRAGLKGCSLEFE
jgi:hypothetical protein